MANAYIFYNPLAGGGQILADLDVLQFVLDDECILCDMTKPETYGEALFSMKPEDYLVLCGGDGTLNRFVNLTAELDRRNEILYFPAGEHNDFAADFGRRYGDNPFLVDRYIRSLPKLRTGEKETAFLTGVSFLPREKQPLSLSVTADGKQLVFENVCFAAVLYGNHAFGGMHPIPERTRQRQDVTLLLMKECTRLHARQVLHRLQRGRTLPHARCIQTLSSRQLYLGFNAQVQTCLDGEQQLLQTCSISFGKDSP